MENDSCKKNETGINNKTKRKTKKKYLTPFSSPALVLQPIAITGSQHYYGQTIAWDQSQQGASNGPSSQDQDYVGKSADGLQPKVYIALNSHATYFRQGDFKTTTGSSNHGCQYQNAPNSLPVLDDETGSTLLNYQLRIFNDAMISNWNGRWGQDSWIPGTTDDGPQSPLYRATQYNMWYNPKDFNNYYKKLQSYPSGEVRLPDTVIP